MEENQRPHYSIIIKWAQEQGYHYDPRGFIIGKKGNKLTVKCCGSQKYPTFSVNYHGSIFGIPAHKFAGFCLWGMDSFASGMCVRHMNGNTNDFSAENLRMGTHSQNNMDKDPEVRRMAARKARAAQGKSPLNKVLSSEMESRILEDFDARCKASGWFLGLAGELSSKYSVTLGVIYGLLRRERGHVAVNTTKFSKDRELEIIQKYLAIRSKYKGRPRGELKELYLEYNISPVYIPRLLARYSIVLNKEAMDEAV